MKEKIYNIINFIIKKIKGKKNLNNEKDFYEKTLREFAERYRHNQ
jgi:hypothetical protein